MNVTTTKGQEWFTITEIAAVIGCHARTITRDSERNPLVFPKPLVIGLGQKRYRLDEVVAYYRQRNSQ